MQVVLAQINFEPGDVQAHLERLKDIIRQYSQADLIVFPELILHGHPSQLKPEGLLYRQVKNVLAHASRDIYRHVRQCGARVILGQLKKRGERYFNMATYVDKQGEQHYTKTHVHWTENFVAGRRLKIFETPLGRIGINICYDSAFVEVWRVLALMGACLAVNISAVPSSFPARHMRARMRGAAAFNQFPVVFVNRPEPKFCGHSGVYGSQGEELLAMGNHEKVSVADLDPQASRLWREEEVLFANRRPLLYRRIALRNKYVPGSEENFKAVG